MVSPSSKRQRLKVSNDIRSVRFSSLIAVRLMPSCKDTEMSEEDVEDIRATWYSKEDIRSQQDATLDDISDLRQGMPEDDATNVTYRGIEHLATPESNYSRKFRRRAYVDAVLIEQYRQWSSGQESGGKSKKTDEHAIAMAAACLSLNDGLAAVTKAKKDEDAARTILAGDATTASYLSLNDVDELVAVAKAKKDEEAAKTFLAGVSTKTVDAHNMKGTTAA